MSDGKLEFDTELNTHGMETELEKTGSKAEKASGRFLSLKSAAGKLGDSLKRMAEFASKAFINLSGGILGEASNVAKAGDLIDKQSQKVGLSYEGYQKWDYAMRLAGASMSDCTVGLKTLTNTFDDAQNGSAGAIKKFERLGLSMDELKGKSREEVFAITIEALQNVADETEKAALANDLFGRSGQDLMPLLNQSSAKTQEILEQAEKYGMVMSNDAVSASAIFEDSLTKLNGTIGGLKNRIIGELLPGITQITDGLSDLISGNRDAGEIFGEMTTRIAEQVPKMIDTAVDFIGSFASAIWNNRGKLFEAVKKVIFNIKEKLIALLPESVREPIKKAVENVESSLGSIVGAFKSIFTGEGVRNAVKFVVELIGKITATINNIIQKVLPAFENGFKTLKRAFESEGFKRAVDLVADIIGKFAVALADIAGKIIPPLCDALGWVVENLDILLPLIGAAAGAWGAWKVINKVTEWCGAFADKAKNVVEKLAEIGTSASGSEGASRNLITTLLNFPGGQIAALVGTAISALAVLTAYLVTNDDKAKAVAGALDSMQKSADKKLESAQKVADRFAIVGEAADEFKEKIDNAAGSIHNFDSQIDSERSTKLAGEMTQLQKQFNEIADFYSDERKKLTDSEIEKLEELFTKMREVAGQELKIQMGYQEVEMGLADSFVSDFSGTAQEYADQSAEHLKIAAEARDSARKAEEEYYRNELANINRMYANPIEAREHREEAKLTHEQRLDEIQSFYDKTVGIIREGYDRTNDTWKTFLNSSRSVYGELAEVRRRYEKDLEASESYGEHAQEMRLNAQTIFNQRTEKLWDEYIKDFSETNAKELGIWLQLVRNAQENGEQIDQDTANAVEFFLRVVSQLPQETQKSMSDTVSLAESILAPLPEEMKNKAGDASYAWISGISDIPEKTAAETDRIKQSIVEKLGELPDEYKALGSKLAAEYASGISSPYSLSEIEKAAEEVKKTLRTMFYLANSEIRGAAGELGRMVAQGYIDGVNSQLSPLKSVGNDLAKTVLDGIRIGQRSNSPSKAAKELGEYLSDGYSIGIENGEKEVTSSARKMTEAALGIIRNAGSGIGRLVSGGLGFFGRAGRKSSSDYLPQLRAEAASQMSAVNARLSGTRYAPSQSGDGRITASGNIETHLHIDGREFAVVTAPYMNEELAFIRG